MLLLFIKAVEIVKPINFIHTESFDCAMTVSKMKACPKRFSGIIFYQAKLFEAVSCGIDGRQGNCAKR
jgi:hypothetical protein